MFELTCHSNLEGGKEGIRGDTGTPVAIRCPGPPVNPRFPRHLLRLKPGFLPQPQLFCCVELSWPSAALHQCMYRYIVTRLYRSCFFDWLFVSATWSDFSDEDRRPWRPCDDEALPEVFLQIYCTLLECSRLMPSEVGRSRSSSRWRTASWLENCNFVDVDDASSEYSWMSCKRVWRSCLFLDSDGNEREPSSQHGKSIGDMNWIISSELKCCCEHLQAPVDYWCKAPEKLWCRPSEKARGP